MSKVAGRVDVAARFRGWSERPGGSADGGRRRRLARMEGRGRARRPDRPGLRLEGDATVGAAVIGRRTFDLGVGLRDGTRVLIRTYVVRKSF